MLTVDGRSLDKNLGFILIKKNKKKKKKKKKNGLIALVLSFASGVYHSDG